MMVKAIDIKAELAKLPFLRDRGPHTGAEQTRAAFAILAPYREGSIFTGSFSGETAWERHRNGDELVQILDGATMLTIITEAGRRAFELTAGMLIVVPQGCWHRFQAPKGVTVLTATPLPTDHTCADDPTTSA
jgi:mannose-6-phosphate isomerase-like protein (cupin superfamily)